MRIEHQRLTCKCGHVFEAETVADAPIEVWIASMRACHCPKCGGTKLGLGGRYNDAPPLTAPVWERAAWWQRRGDCGTSSLTMWCAFTCGDSPHGRFDYPHDPDDFSRCKLLLDLIPEWRLALQQITTRFPWFKPFIDRWDKFDELWAAESPSGTCPLLYDEMKISGKEADALRRKEKSGR